MSTAIDNYSGPLIEDAATAEETFNAAFANESTQQAKALEDDLDRAVSIEDAQKTLTDTVIGSGIVVAVGRGGTDDAPVLYLYVAMDADRESVQALLHTTVPDNVYDGYPVVLRSIHRFHVMLPQGDSK